MQQPVGVEAQQVGVVAQLRVAERAVEQAHVAQGERLGRRRRRRGRRDRGESQESGDTEGRLHARIMVRLAQATNHEPT